MKVPYALYYCILGLLFMVYQWTLQPALPTPAVNLEIKDILSRSKIDEHGVVCYTTANKYDFSCVKVK